MNRDDVLKIVAEANKKGIRADLRDADLDCAVWPLWCGSFDLGATDDRLTSQLVHHALHVAKANYSDYGRAVLAVLLPLQRFHMFQQDVEEVKP